MSENIFFTIEQHSNKGFFNLSSILKDLFSNKILELKNDDEQEPSISQINLFIPDDLIKKFEEIIENNANKKTKKDYYKDFINSSNTYTLGNEVIKYFNKNGISPFIKTFKQNSNKCTIIDDRLHDFLTKMETALFSGDNISKSEEAEAEIDKIKEILFFDNDKAYSKYKSVYGFLLEEKLHKNILARILISVIILQRQTKDCPRAKYLISSVISKLNKKTEDEIKTELFRILDRIWLSFDKNDDDERKVLNELINNSIEKGEFEFTKKLCELNLDKLIDDLVNKKAGVTEKEFESNLLSYTKVLIKYNKISEAERILTSTQFNENSDAQFLLYKIYNGDFGKFDTENDKENSKIRLENAANLKHPEAVLIRLNELVDNFDKNLVEISKKLSFLKDKEDYLNEHQKKHYYYYLGCYKKKNALKEENLEKKDKLINEANKYLKKALDLGNGLARTKIDKSERDVVDFGKCFNTESRRRICIINSNNYQTKALLKTLPEEYCVFSINANFSNTEIENIYEFTSLKRCIDKLINEKSLKEAIICLFSDNEQENLNQTIEILDRLYNEALLNKKEKNDRIDFINSFDIFIKANYDYASMFIDASISDMGDDIYFKTHIIDKYKNSIQKLLYEKPLYSPMLENNTTESNTIIISNNINFNISTLKEIISIGYMGEKYTVSTAVVCDKSIKTELENKLYTEMPGIFKYKLSAELDKLLLLDEQIKNSLDKPKISLDKNRIIRPNIFSYDNESVPLSFVLNVASHNISEEKYQELFKSETNTTDKKNIYNILTKDSSNKNKPLFKSIFINNDNECYKKLNSANYFIVDVGTDKENIDFAINLRKQFMANSKDMKRRPIIAVYCRSSKTAYLAEKITLSNQNQGDRWYNEYGLYFFGMDNTIYSYDALTNNVLENQALHMHKAYCNIENENLYSDKYHNALNSFYSYQYNIDSSITTAIALKYRSFIAGYYKSENDFNHNKPENNDFAKIEHYRWVNFMLSRGWQAPTFDQLSTYISDDEITNHKYMLLKLHPFIANWDDLDDDGDICKKISSSQKQFTSPKKSTRNNVEKAWNLLFSFKKTEIETNAEKEH